ncbi:AAA family ATPase [Mycolicibacterium sp. BiH015]|uniref:ATP-binding protein n=1 Tax=Mycolicibacterium sp. BiH015 TaxID=3018808 RepID=UPI0022E82E5B|nr:adenylate/guanylate cyclase domain-containing protein [Mycolicibacterium sp. BiH015]MDA2894887.1 AAA family ATPase [Mycolicibacterium sp. BiH015]
MHSVGDSQENRRGTTATMCGVCGASSGLTGRFCTECGARIAAAAPAAEYKQVTVLFADVVQSMELAAALDMERLRDIMTDVIERTAAVARNHGGGVVEYSGDGLMVLFGAPIALEDHAFRACLAALAIQEEVRRLATKVLDSDGVTVRVRVGLNSGRVIAGVAGEGALRYAATGETVGYAQRMESVAPPGAVMVSQATARLVEHAVTLAEPEPVHIKGADGPVRAQRLLSINPRNHPVRRTEARLVGRGEEIAALGAMLERTVRRRGGVVNVLGSPGIGKSRLAREVASLATDHGIEVVWGFCESHAREIPLHAATNMLRAATGVANLDNDAARAIVRQQFSPNDPEDLLLLDEMLGIAAPDVPLPPIDPPARRRRLTALINNRTLTRSAPTLFIIEDVHWIDAVSESLLADFLAVIPRTASTVLITCRPEYSGRLLQADGAQTLVLDPLDNSAISAVLSDLIGSDPSVAELSSAISRQAGGNPFFAEEMVREMAQRGVLIGKHGEYTCRADATQITVPATVEAAIEARIDRLSAPAKRTLTAASVIGARFDADLLGALVSDQAMGELLSTELIDKVEYTPRPAYAFRHPLIRAVAYESQLKSVRAQWHQRLATTIEQRASGSVDECAALIAEHLEAAGDTGAYEWHMRAGEWSANRDLEAARANWRRACRLADQLPSDHPELMRKRTAPRTMLCATDIQARDVKESRARFAELQSLCDATGDKLSLAIGMSAVATEALYSGRAREGARLSSQQVALLETIDDPTPIMGLAPVTFCNWHGVLEFGEVLRWSQTLIDMAAGDPVKGAGYGVGSPLAIALGWRGTARWCLGRPGWRRDLHDAVAMARRSNPETFSGAIAWTYGFALQCGVLPSTAPVVQASEDAVQAARRASSDRAVGLAAYTLGVALLVQDGESERHRGLELMCEARELWSRRGALFLIPATDVWIARETARRGDRDKAVESMRRAVSDLRHGYPFYGVWATGVLAETLLERKARGDVPEAHNAMVWLEELATSHHSAMVEMTLLRVQALLAHARDDPAHPHLAGRYHARAALLEFERHTLWAEEMIHGR